MVWFIGFRLVQGVISLVILSMIIFGLTRLSGDPALMMINDNSSRAEYEQIHRSLGLDRPIHEQYYIYVTKALQGDLGISIHSRQPVSQLLAQRLPNTFALLGVAAIMTIFIAVPLGTLAGANTGSFIDRFGQLVSGLGQSVPVFVVGFVLILVFSVYLRILPSGGMVGWKSYIMPSLCVAIFWAAGIIRVLRSSMIDAIRSDFVKFARIKGVSRSRTVWVHALRNSLLPVVSLGGMYVAIGITSSVIIEAVFSWPGVGDLVQHAIASRDFPVIQGVVLTASLIIVVANILTDLVYAALDPRIRL